MEGIIPSLDKLQENLNMTDIVINTASVQISKILPVIRGGNAVRRKYNTSEGHFLMISNKNLAILQNYISKKPIIIRISSDKKIKLSNKNMIVKKMSTSSKIFIKDLDKYSTNLVEYQKKVKCACQAEYKNKIRDMYSKYVVTLSKVQEFVALTDFLVSGAILAQKYYYCRPIIPNNGTSGSYFKAKKLRHAIIERINETTEYVPHDIALGNGQDHNGMLLFGVNSSGKSSLMKAVGIAVILAQIGYYVPAESFEYEPYLMLFARITGNDNLFKGQSSFILEMTEIDSIVNSCERYGKNTLVIGDEVCRGTDTKSAVTLVATTLEHISNKNATYIFSSHLHKLPKLKVVKDIDNLIICHLLVTHDEEHDCLICDRKLVPDQGPDNYGLEVAKYIIKNKHFMTRTRQVSAEIKGTPQIKRSKYNAKLNVKECAICGYVPTKKHHKEIEVHHINFQVDCYGDGKIKKKPYLYKNHLCNLVPLCRGCHENAHHGNIIINGYRDTAIGKILDYVKV
jgi:DNA mismatch repair protein MutS